jgi:SAM-dependent methyltransferase
MEHELSESGDVSRQPTQFELWNEQAGPHWAEQWQRYDRMLRPFGQYVLDALAARPGERVVDIGCGNGDLSLSIASQVWEDGHVLGVDLSAPMLARARERAAGMRNVRFVHADAATHPFEPASFDALASRFGVMFFEDPKAAFANMAGALEPGGRVAFVCWREMAQNAWMSVVGMAVAPHIPLPPVDPEAPGPFAFASADRVRDILDAAGLRGVTFDAVDEPLRVGSDIEDAITYLRSSDIGRRVLTNAPEDAVERAVQAVREALRDYASDDGVLMPSAAWLVTARR